MISLRSFPIFCDSWKTCGIKALGWVKHQRANPQLRGVRAVELFLGGSAPKAALQVGIGKNVAIKCGINGEGEGMCCV